ncbi:hypothetical protein A3Q32_19810 [Alcanivorax sp. KX64203]|nr:hypothetical protein A3Q32_19810 [Alcanivorax sp. KX64203]
MITGEEQVPQTGSLRPGLQFLDDGWRTVAILTAGLLPVEMLHRADFRGHEPPDLVQKVRRLFRT